MKLRYYFRGDDSTIEADVVQTFVNRGVPRFISSAAVETSQVLQVIGQFRHLEGRVEYCSGKLLAFMTSPRTNILS